MSSIGIIPHRLSSRAATVIGALALLVCVSATPAIAADNAPAPPGQASCLFAGASYSPGSERQQAYIDANGRVYYKTYRCENGEWKFVSQTAPAPRTPPVTPTIPIPPPAHP